MSRSTYLCLIQLAKLLPGPFFVAFPNLREAIQNNVPIKTQARDCTILPNFIGCVLSLYLLLHALKYRMVLAGCGSRCTTARITSLSPSRRIWWATSLGSSRTRRSVSHISASDFLLLFFTGANVLTTIMNVNVQTVEEQIDHLSPLTHLPTHYSRCSPPCILSHVPLFARFSLHVSSRHSAARPQKHSCNAVWMTVARWCTTNCHRGQLIPTITFVEHILTDVRPHVQLSPSSSALTMQQHCSRTRQRPVESEVYRYVYKHTQIRSTKPNQTTTKQKTRKGGHRCKRKEST